MSPLVRLPETAPEMGDPLRPLVDAVRAGNADAFQQLYEQTRELAHAVLFRLVGPSSEMEDLLQETYLQLLHALRDFRGDARTSTFVYRVCANVGLMHLRRTARRKEELSAELPESVMPIHHSFHPSPEHAVEVKQAASLLERALGRLNEDKRVVFVYHELLGLRPEEISAALGVPVNTVRSRLSRAREEVSAQVASLTQWGQEGGRRETP